MLAFVLLAIYFAIDALRDSWFEAYKLKLIDLKGEEPPAKYLGYSPTRKGFIFRDSWHDLKFIQHSIVVALIAIYVPFLPSTIWRVGVGLAVWALVFNPVLWLARKK